MDLKNTNGAVTKVVPGSADAKLLIRRQMITFVYASSFSLYLELASIIRL